MTHERARHLVCVDPSRDVALGVFERAPDGGEILHAIGRYVLDADGRLLGFNTQRLGEGFYLALPADGSLRARIDALGRGESTVRPRLGIAVAP